FLERRLGFVFVLDLGEGAERVGFRGYRQAHRRSRQGPIWPRWRSRWSASTMASMASATGVPRIATHGSWRPLVTISRSAPARSTVRRGVRMELVGFTAMRATIGCPVLIPPRMPPAWFDR